jgi:phage gpG-like protein
MADEESFSIELKGLNQLVKALKAKPPVVRIGILGSGARATKSGQNKSISNATIGAVHEFGAPARGIPQRSFLRIPLTDNLNKELEQTGLLDKDTLNAVIKSGSMLPWMKQVAIAAEAVVDDAFENSGNGKWPKWKDPNYTNEGGMLLVDTGSLREAITSEVKE